jgi:hypothetical protein
MKRLRGWMAGLVMCAMLGPLATIQAAAAAPAAHVAPLQPLKAADVPRLMGEAKGAPLIVEIWSIDCGYCRENTAHVVEWLRTHRGVRVAMIAMDAFDGDAQGIAQALASMPVAPQIAQYANAEAIPERLRAALDPGWQGEMPRTLLIDAKGRRRASSGLIQPGALDAWLHAP